MGPGGGPARADAEAAKQLGVTVDAIQSVIAELEAPAGVISGRSRSGWYMLFLVDTTTRPP
jgi:predicted transcriptional regulator